MTDNHHFEWMTDERENEGCRRDCGRRRSTHNMNSRARTMAERKHEEQDDDDDDDQDNDGDQDDY